MPSTLPPPPAQEPSKDTYVWINWFQQLYQYITLIGRISWTVIDFASSNITDIVSRAHNDLTTFQGGNTTERYHLTSAQHTVVAATSGSNTGDQINITGNAATVTTNAGLTGPITSSGNTTSINAQTGTGSIFAMSVSPVLTTPMTVGYTVATLPAGTTGMMAYVTDATTPTYLGALTGGGAVVCPVFYNGSAWLSV